jgi:hypothetical protein
MPPTSARRRLEERDPRAGFRSLFVGLAGVFTLGAVAVAVARSRQPFDHGWWLVAYLGLVGGLSQVVLGAGQVGLGAASAAGKLGLSKSSFCGCLTDRSKGFAACRA